ncbi:MAG TPA: hypothetical protein G4N98_07960 [Thermoflexia bacterium]|nr:hypothetical protein [Thermoflexia bacterium]
MTKRVLLYGNSIFLSGLAAQLLARDDIDVRQRTSHGGLLHLDDLDAVIVDFNDVQPADVLALLRTRPSLKVVGVNAAGGAVTVLFGQVHLVQTLADVMQCMSS